MTITLAHYVALIAPHCQLTYGVLPCKAQLSFSDGNEPHNIDFNGMYIRRTAGLTAAADSKSFTVNFWAEKTDPLGDSTIFAGTTTAGGTTLRFEIFWLTSGRIRFRGWTSGGTLILDVSTSVLVASNLYHVVASIDLNSTSNRFIYVDGVSDLGVNTYTNNTIDFTLGDWSLAALPNGTSKFDGHLAQFWFKPGTFIDLSVAANREKFRSSVGRPVFLGDNGEAVTGSQPLMFMDWDAGNFANNTGSGGNFTKFDSGSESDAAFSTGNNKCFNSLGTCQDLADFDDTDSPLIAFGEDVGTDPLQSIFGYYFPFIKSIDFNSAIVSLGDNMGQRGSVTVTMRDAPHNDLPISVFDSYRGERGYEADTQGTFWGRFRARNPYMRFAPLYVFTCQRDANGDIDGTVETRTYLIDSISGPDNNGDVKITAKDTLKVADGDYAQAPVQSAGFLAADISDTDTTAVMSPSGAIDEYPSAFYACVGGSEIIGCSKTGGDNLSLFERGAYGTTASSHNAQDRIQHIYLQEAQSPDLIIHDLLVNFAGVDSSLIDSDTWAAEVAAYLNTVYTFVIPEPTAVNSLVSEIIQQIGAAIWWDDVNAQIRLQILRQVPTDAERWTVDQILAKSMQIQEQEDKRVTEVSVYFAQLNPTLKVDETRNYASVATVTDDAMESLVGGKSIKTIFARGIASGGRTVAERLAQKYLSRYVQPPRKFNFELLKYAGQRPALGGGYQIAGDNTLDVPTLGLYWMQDQFGNMQGAAVQVTRLNPVGMKYQVEAEEVLYTAYGADIDPTNHTVVFDVSRLDVNLRTVHDSVYAAAVSGDTVNCYVNSGVIIGSSSTATPAFEVGTFAGGVTVNLFVNGRIQGHGGKGGGAVTGGTIGQAGGTALYTRQAITVENNSEIWGGGGGGGLTNGQVGAGPDRYSNSGGGGAGSLPGAAGVPSTFVTYQNAANSGTTEAGGTAPFSPQGGNGGGPGLAGQNASGGAFLNTAGGAAGNAIDGNAFITYSATGDRRGGII